MFLIISWILLVMPTPTVSMPDPKEFQVPGVSFVSLADCDAAAKKWMPDLTNEAHLHKTHRKSFVWGQPSAAPKDATVTYSCVEHDE